MPHIANECLEKFNYTDDIKWPEISKKSLIDEEIEIVIQINGKKKYTIKAEKDIDEDKILKKIKDADLLKKVNNEKEFIKTIYVKNRIINYIYK